MELHHQFTYTGGEYFDFDGDDDLILGDGDGNIIIYTNQWDGTNYSFKNIENIKLMIGNELPTFLGILIHNLGGFLILAT